MGLPDALNYFSCLVAYLLSRGEKNWVLLLLRMVFGDANRI